MNKITIKTVSLSILFLWSYYFYWQSIFQLSIISHNFFSEEKIHLNTQNAKQDINQKFIKKKLFQENKRRNLSDCDIKRCFFMSHIKSLKSPTIEYDILPFTFSKDLLWIPFYLLIPNSTILSKTHKWKSTFEYLNFYEIGLFYNDNTYTVLTIEWSNSNKISIKRF